MALPPSDIFLQAYACFYSNFLPIFIKLLLIKSGLTPYEAIWAATVAPVEFLGKENEFGTLKPGKRADI